jgi:drug/metabolite transporter (DMT)-like permease
MTAQEKPNKQLLYNLLVVRAFLSACGPVSYMVLIGYGLEPFTTVAYMLLAGGVFTLFTGYVFSLRTKSADRIHLLPELQKQSKRTLVLILLLAVTAPAFNSIYVASMMEGTITETTVMARLGVLFAIPFSLMFLANKIVSVRNLVLGYVCILTGVALFKWADISTIFNAGATVITLGLIVAFISAIQDTTYMYLGKYAKLRFTTSAGLGMIIGGFGFLLVLSAIGYNWYTPSLWELFMISGIGFLTIGIPNVIASTVGRDLGQPILASVATLLGLVFTAILAYYIKDEALSTMIFVIMIVFMGIGLYLVKSSEKPKDSS